MLPGQVSERDEDVLAYLKDIRSKDLTGEQDVRSRAAVLLPITAHAQSAMLTLAPTRVLKLAHRRYVAAAG